MCYFDNDPNNSWTDAMTPINVESSMDFYECADSNYPDIHKCVPYGFWGY